MDSGGSDSELVVKTLGSASLSSNECDGCRDLNDLLYTSCLETIRVSAEEGCQYCRLLRDITDSYTPGVDGKHSNAIAGDRFRIKLLCYDGQSTNVTIYGGKVRTRDGLRETLVLSYFQPPEIISDTSSPEVMSKIWYLLIRCDNTHAKCTPKFVYGNTKTATT